MAPGRKLGQGCWTCRLRRKQCRWTDSTAGRAICDECQHLGITCHSGDTRPAWMDGGAEQKLMTETVKRDIKRNAQGRRDRRRLTRLGEGIEPNTRPSFEPSPPDSTDEASPTSAGNGAIPEPHISTQSQHDNTFSSGSFPYRPGGESQSPYAVASSASNPTPLSTASAWTDGAAVAVPQELQLGSIMVYLDYVFPFLFPFYRPSLMETGRQWLLGRLCQNGVSFHTAAALSAYFFTLVPQAPGQEIQKECKALVWDRLVQQMELAVQTIQNRISAMQSQNASNSLEESTRIMEEIIQLLIVEVTVRKEVDWSIHLTPAVALFDEVFQTHGLDHLGPSMPQLLGTLPQLRLPLPSVHHKPMPNTMDQAAVVFFFTLLLFVDIISSTAVGRPPALQKYHQSLLLPQSEGKNPALRLEAVIGCETWALLAIGNISALHAWKSESKQNGSFSVVKLVTDSAPITQALEDGLKSLDDKPLDLQLPRDGASRLEGYYTRHDRAIDHASMANVTRAWAFAAKLYLSVVLSGWQTNSTEVQDGVSRVLSLLQGITSPAQLRSLSWPMCVAGCLALPTQEQAFRDIVHDIGELGEFGTCGTALRIMETVWSHRNTIDGNTWDFAACFSILGSPPLLI